MNLREKSKICGRMSELLQNIAEAKQWQKMIKHRKFWKWF